MSDYLPAQSMTFGEAGRELTYRQLLLSNGEIDIFIARAIATKAATRAHEKYQHSYDNRPWQECFDMALRQVLDIAKGMRDAELARREAAARPVREQLIRSLSFELKKAREGLAMPYDADKVARLEAALEKANSPECSEAAE